jgi:raffinose/stachyose/melibiose transport system permease protein
VLHCNIASERSRKLFIFFFLLPGILIYSIFYIYPIFLGFRVTFYESVKGFLDTFVGFKNFKLLFGHETFRVQFFNAIGNNFTFLLISLAGSNILAILIAYTLSVNKLRGSVLFRNILFSPQVIPIVTVGFVCSLILNPSLGPYQKIAEFLNLPPIFHNLLGKTNTALPTIALIEVIRLLGFPFTIFYVAINDIPFDIISSGRVDGANDFTILTRIVLPIISPIIVTANILMFIGSFIYFDLIYVMQGYLGGPAYSTDVLGTFFYRTTFGGHHGGGEAGIGAVISICMLFILAIGTALGLLLQRYLRSKLD